jgi:type II secretory pathway pseudopilin PulG
MSADAQDGFALVDVLVALAIAGLAGSIMMGLVAFVRHQTSSLDQQAQIRSGLLSVDRTFRALGEHAYFVSDAGSGSPDEFTVITEGPAILQLPYPIPFTLKREKDNDATDNLVLLWRDPKTKQERHEIVMPGVKSIAFSYFSASTGSTNAAWRLSWHRGDQPPQSIRLIVKPAFMRDSVEFVIPLRSQVSVSCLRDPVQRHCPRELR